MSQLLFPEEIPVSEEEVQAWLDAVPNLSAGTFRLEAYCKAYNVNDTIRTATAILKAPSNHRADLP